MGQVGRERAAHVADHQDEADRRCAGDDVQRDDDQFDHAQRMLDARNAEQLPHLLALGAGRLRNELHDCGEQVERRNGNDTDPADDRCGAGFQDTVIVAVLFQKCHPEPVEGQRHMYGSTGSP